MSCTATDVYSGSLPSLWRDDPRRSSHFGKPSTVIKKWPQLQLTLQLYLILFILFYTYINQNKKYVHVTAITTWIATDAILDVAPTLVSHQIELENDHWAVDLD